MSVGLLLAGGWSVGGNGAAALEAGAVKWKVVMLLKRTVVVGLVVGVAEGLMDVLGEGSSLVSSLEELSLSLEVLRWDIALSAKTPVCLSGVEVARSLDALVKGGGKVGVDGGRTFAGEGVCKQSPKLTGGWMSVVVFVVATVELLTGAVLGIVVTAR